MTLLVNNALYTEQPAGNLCSLQTQRHAGLHRATPCEATAPGIAGQPGCKASASDEGLPEVSGDQQFDWQMHWIAQNTRIFEDTTSEWILPYVAESLQWPRSHAALTASAGQ